MNLSGKTVMITGCGSGIGRHLTQTFYQKGANIVVTDIDESKLDFTSNWDKNRFLAYKLDVTSKNQWKDVIGKVRKKWKHIDILVNNAGIADAEFFVDIKDENHLDKPIDVNLKGTVYGVYYTLPLLKEGSVIINISSLAGVAPIPGISLYSASKFGVRGFTLAIAPELEKHGIFVYNVSPDAVLTPLLEKVKRYSASNMIFSGAILQCQDIEKAIIKLLNKPRRREILLPWWRGFLAKFGNCFPYLASPLIPLLTKKGDKKRKQFQ